MLIPGDARTREQDVGDHQLLPQVPGALEIFEHLRGHATKRDRLAQRGCFARHFSLPRLEVLTNGPALKHEAARAQPRTLNLQLLGHHLFVVQLR